MSSSDNKNFLSMLVIIIVFLVFIGPKFPDRFPDPVLKLFLNPYFRALIVFVSIYSIQFNITFSILITLIFFIIMNRIENSFLFELFLSGYQEHLDSFVGSNQNYEEMSDQDSGLVYSRNRDKVKKCTNYVVDKFPCNNKNKNDQCCENLNYDQFVKDDNGNAKNVTLFMNQEIANSDEYKNMNGINNINQWCQNYINDDGKSTIDLGCKNKELIKKCKQINQICDYNKWEPKKVVQEDELTGTCALPCKNLHDQVCFDINPKNDKCKNFNKQQCIKNKKDCFYIENNQFINSKVKSGNSTFKCKIPDKNDQLPKNCFPVKLYKDSCGNVGMGCWVKSSEVEPKQHEHEQEHQPSE